MPAYEFKCKNCGEEFTLDESFKEHREHHEKCPKCRSKRIEQLISAIHVKTAKKS